MKKKTLYAAAALVALMLIAVFTLDVPHWKRLDPSLLEHLQTASVVYDRNGQEAFSLYGTQKRRLVSIGELPEYVPQAFVAAEDLRFYSHHGVDFRRIFGAALRNLRSGGLNEGASTITQQLIKLTHLSPEKTFARKLQEACLAIQAERAYSKDQILEMYMNVAYFGSGAYGIGMAAETYFGKSASELDLSEAAVLAGVIKAPSSYSPNTSMDKALRRRDYVLRAMVKGGFISEGEAQAAAGKELRLAEKASDYRSGWYRDLVLREASDVLGVPAEQVLGGGYAIYTSLDPTMQRQADQVMRGSDAFPADDVQGAMIAVSADHGGILAVSGGRTEDGAMGLNRATDSRRQPGSAIKPISTFAAAIDSAGWLPSDFLNDEKQVYSGGYIPGNAGDTYYGKVTMRTALSRSLNAATVWLANEIGVPIVREYARRFGIPTEDDEASLSFALGSMTYGATPSDMATAYAALANGGTRVKAHTIERITDAKGREIYRYTPDGERVVSRETAAMLIDMLETAASEGSAKALSGTGIPVAAKTGTVASDRGTRDLWTVACTPELSVAVWMGYDSAEQGVMPEWASGSAYPARLAAEWISGVKTELTGEAFALPDTLVRADIDRMMLEERQEVLLAQDLAPAEERLAEVFPANRLPLRLSTRFSPPAPVQDATLRLSAAGKPIIEFTARQPGMEYLVMRDQGGETMCVAQLSGEPGELLAFTDEDASQFLSARYTIVTRQADLYAGGSLSAAESASSLRFEPFAAQLIPIQEPEAVAEDDAPALFAP